MYVFGSYYQNLTQTKHFQCENNILISRWRYCCPLNIKSFVKIDFIWSIHPQEIQCLWSSFYLLPILWIKIIQIYWKSFHFIYYLHLIASNFALIWFWAWRWCLWKIFADQVIFYYWFPAGDVFILPILPDGPSL